MTEADSLRHAMEDDAAQYRFRSVDIERAMRVGRRMRTRRHLLATGGVLAATAALVTVVSVGLPGAATDRRDTTVAPSDPSVKPDGDVIPTGMHDATGEFVLYLVAGYQTINRQGIPVPGDGYGLALGHRDTNGSIVPLTITGSSDLSPGFHSLTRGAVPLYGFYSGPVARIRVSSDDHEVGATIARWSRNPDIAIFWVSPSNGFAAATKGAYDISAYDVNGETLPH